MKQGKCGKTAVIKEESTAFVDLIFNKALYFTGNMWYNPFIIYSGDEKNER